MPNKILKLFLTCKNRLHSNDAFHSYKLQTFILIIHFVFLDSTEAVPVGNDNTDNPAEPIGILTIMQ